MPLLVAGGHVVAEMTRSPAKADRITELGAEPVVCDVYDADSLSRRWWPQQPDPHRGHAQPAGRAADGRAARCAVWGGRGGRVLAAALNAARPGTLEPPAADPYAG